MSRIPVVLDLDGSALGLEPARVVPLREREQALRFGCSMRVLEDFAQALDTLLPEDHGTLLTGSGDFHHLSLPLIRRAVRQQGPLAVVVLDNHPDNMRFPFGVHCGSWVARVCAIPGVRHVHVAGITSADIALAHAWENRWWPLRHGRLTYWSIGVSTRWADRVGLGQAFRNHEDAETLLQALGMELAATDTPLYLSIDKDVLSAEDARTNWDQGGMREGQMTAFIRALAGRIVASDLTGDVSQARYHQRWKRLLSALDRQPEIAATRLEQWQTVQRELNQRLVREIARATRACLL